jgi:hypothetical protein
VATPSRQAPKPGRSDEPGPSSDDDSHYREFNFLKTKIYVENLALPEGAGAIVQYMNTNVNGGDARLAVSVRRKSNKSW